MKDIEHTGHSDAIFMFRSAVIVLQNEMTPLLWAAIIGNTEMVQTLLNGGANVDLTGLVRKFHYVKLYYKTSCQFLVLTCCRKISIDDMHMHPY